MNAATVRQLCLDFMAKADAAYLSTVQSDGFPRTRAMLNLRNTTGYPGLASFFKGLGQDMTIYFTTNASLGKVKQIEANPAAAVYYCEPGDWKGLLLQGRAEIVTDAGIKQRLWQPSWTLYYPAGPDDPEYVIFQVQPHYVRYYHRLQAWELDPRLAA